MLGSMVNAVTDVNLSIRLLSSSGPMVNLSELRGSVGVSNEAAHSVITGKIGLNGTLRSSSGGFNNANKNRSVTTNTVVPCRFGSGFLRLISRVIRCRLAGSWCIFGGGEEAGI